MFGSQAWQTLNCLPDILDLKPKWPDWPSWSLQLRKTWILIFVPAHPLWFGPVRRQESRACALFRVLWWTAMKAVGFSVGANVVRGVAVATFFLLCLSRCTSQPYHRPGWRSAATFHCWLVVYQALMLMQVGCLVRARVPDHRCSCRRLCSTHSCWLGPPRGILCRREWDLKSCLWEARAHRGITDVGPHEWSAVTLCDTACQWILKLLTNVLKTCSCFHYCCGCGKMKQSAAADIKHM